jgi:hypothetical protein
MKRGNYLTLFRDTSPPWLRPASPVQTTDSPPMRTRVGKPSFHRHDFDLTFPTNDGDADVEIVAP